MLCVALLSQDHADATPHAAHTTPIHQVCVLSTSNKLFLLFLGKYCIHFSTVMTLIVGALTKDHKLCMIGDRIIFDVTKNEVHGENQKVFCSPNQLMLLGIAGDATVCNVSVSGIIDEFIKEIESMQTKSRTAGAWINCLQKYVSQI